MTTSGTAATDIPHIAPTGTAHRYVEPSAERVLAAGEKVGQLFRRQIEQPFVLQRLTDDVWWVSVRNFSTVFHVGDRTVMLFDPLENAFDDLTAAIASVTAAPIGTVLYSHFHVDHIGDAGRYTDAAERAGADLRIVASGRTAAKLDAARSVMPRPHEVVPWPGGVVTHEGLDVRLHGFEWAAHTEDHAAWLLLGRGVLHVPDLINPDEPPFWRFGGNERFLFTEDNLRETRRLDWQVMCGGHGNVGTHADLDFELTFISALHDACRAEVDAHPRASFARPSAGSHTAWLAAFLAAVADGVVERLRPTFGDLYGFAAATRANAEMMTFDQLQYR